MKGGMLHRLANGNFPSIQLLFMKRKTFLIIIIIITFTFNPEAIKQRRNPINCFLNFSLYSPSSREKKHGEGGTRGNLTFDFKVFREYFWPLCTASKFLIIWFVPKYTPTAYSPRPSWAEERYNKYKTWKRRNSEAAAKSVWKIMKY